MARIELAPEVFDDFDRFFDHMAESGAVVDAPQRISEIIDAMNVFAHSPLIGRKVKGGHRELVIGRSSRGYVALYRFLPDIDTVFTLAFRTLRTSLTQHKVLTAGEVVATRKRPPRGGRWKPPATPSSPRPRGARRASPSFIPRIATRVV